MYNMKQEKETIDGIKKETSYRNFLGEEIVTLITPRPFPYPPLPCLKEKHPPSNSISGFRETESMIFALPIYGPE